MAAEKEEIRCRLTVREPAAVVEGVAQDQRGGRHIAHGVTSDNTLLEHGALRAKRESDAELLGHAGQISVDAIGSVDTACHRGDNERCAEGDPGERGAQVDLVSRQLGHCVVDELDCLKQVGLLAKTNIAVGAEIQMIGFSRSFDGCVYHGASLT